MCVFYWMSTTLHCVSRHHDLAMSESFKCSSPFKGSSFIVVLFELLYNVINWLEIVFLLFWVKLCRVKSWRNFHFYRTRCRYISYQITRCRPRLLGKDEKVWKVGESNFSKSIMISKTRAIWYWKYLIRTKWSCKWIRKHNSFDPLEKCIDLSSNQII